MHLLQNLLGNSSRGFTSIKDGCCCLLTSHGRRRSLKSSISLLVPPAAALVPFQRDWSLRPSPTLEFSHPVLVKWRNIIMREKPKEGEECVQLQPLPLSLCLTRTCALLPIAVMSHCSANQRTGSVFTVKACRCTVPSANQRRPPSSEPPTLSLHFVFLRHNPETEYYH